MPPPPAPDVNADVAVVIPAYNEASVVAAVVQGIAPHVGRVVCVDDGSRDGTADAIATTSADLVCHPLNMGQGAAIQTGVEFALLDPAVRWVVTFDADGQHQVDDVLRMLEVARDGGWDVVFGSRFLDHRTEVTGLKRLVLRAAVAYTNASSGVRLTDAHNGLRVIGRDAAALLDIRHSGMAHASEIVETVGKHRLRHTEVPVHILYTEYSRAKGQSLWNSVNILFDLLFR